MDALKKKKVRFVSCGDTFTTACTSGKTTLTPILVGSHVYQVSVFYFLEGDVYTWGQNSRGRLGRETDSSISSEPGVVQFENTPHTHSIATNHGVTMLLVTEQE